MEEQTHRCGDCKHYQKTDQLNQGECHFNPPQIIGMMAPSKITGQLAFMGQTLFPAVNVKCSGCSFYEAKQS